VLPAEVPSPARWARAFFCALLLIVASGLHATADAATRRKVIIDQDAFGPASSNLQAILLLLQADDVEVLGITVTSGDGWRDEEVSHTLRLLEIAKRTEVPVYAGAVMPLLNSRPHRLPASGQTMETCGG